MPARVVDQAIQAPMHRYAVVNQPFYLVAFGDVTANEGGLFWPNSIQLRFHGFTLGRIPRAENYLRARGCKRLNAALADPLTAAGDDHDLVGIVHKAFHSVTIRFNFVILATMPA